MVRSISFEPLVKSDSKKRGSDEVSVPLGGGNSFPYYWRMLCIAAYRRVKGLKRKTVDDIEKQDILAAILRACPPDYRKDPPDFTFLPLGDMLKAIKDDWTDPVCVNMRELTSARNFDRLKAAGLEAVVDFARVHCSGGELDHDMICRASAMLKLLVPHIARKEAHVKDTPYEGNDRNFQEEDWGSWKELKDAFEAAARNKNLVAKFY